ncbi:MAG: aas3 [Chlamydiales bacterium]|jgi:long-chain-fatty-acid--[acyl-carrier-protein] ligase|nr:aas3 [Chlamydiales bacterium]
MIQKVVSKTLVWVARRLLSLRYRITYRGLDQLDDLPKNSGVLFLPNHSSILVDPLLVTASIWDKHQPRPLIVDYMYYLPIVQSIMKQIRALPVPNFGAKINQIKRRKNEQLFDQVVEGLKKGDNFLLYPAGKIKFTGYEQVIGASGIHRILTEVPNVTIVLIRTQGFWGSMFSRARSPISPPMFKTLKEAFFILLKNGLFFTPRRKITITFEKAPADFPRQASRLETNHWLEEWYNRWEPCETDPSGRPAEPYAYVPYGPFSPKFEPPLERQPIVDQSQDLSGIKESVQALVKEKIADLKEIAASSIRPEMDLRKDLGFDSLDAAELMLFLEGKFGNANLSMDQLTTVKSAMFLARAEERNAPLADKMSSDVWCSKRSQIKPDIPAGETLIEAFLNRVHTSKKELAVADEMSGALNYQTLLVRVLVLAEHLKKQEGDIVGIMLPASVAATAVILACQLAGKTPVMVNWTVGRPHLEALREICAPKLILSSWAFIDRLDDVDLSPIEDLLVMLEDLRITFSLKDRLRALFLSKRCPSAIMQKFPPARHDAVILFTSGSESMPKAVPLSHRNILSNLRDLNPLLDLSAQDVLLSFLPPFHSFGFSVTTLFPLLVGVRTVFSPNPNESKQLVFQAEKWQATLLCGAPTFLKNILRASNQNLSKVRYLISGAEKASKELKDLWAKENPNGALIEGYGITECSPILSFTRPNTDDKGVGRHLESVELLIVHPETLEPAKEAEEGLILARGPNIFSGYLKSEKNPFLSVEGEQWYNTGDIGYLDHKRCLHLVGRLKRFIKIAGEMVSLAAIEDALASALLARGLALPVDGPLIAIIAKELEEDRPRIIAVSPFELGLEDLNQVLREAGFSSLIRISEVRREETIPLMGTGKVDYRNLESAYFV